MAPSPQAAQTLPERLWSVGDVEKHERFCAFAAQAARGGVRMNKMTRRSSSSSSRPVLQQMRQLAVPERHVLLFGSQSVDDVGQ